MKRTERSADDRISQRERDMGAMAIREAEAMLKIARVLLPLRHSARESVLLAVLGSLESQTGEDA